MLTVVLGMLDSYELFMFVESGSRMEFGALLLNVGFSLSLVFAVIFTVWSCIDYVLKYRKYINIAE